MFAYNVQHDCREAKCKASGRRGVVQEYIQSGLKESFIEHKPLDRFLINTHSFHNAHLIRAVLPRDLTKPIPHSTNRKEDHFNLAKKFHSSREVKRQQMTEKRKATEAAKKYNEKNSEQSSSKRRRLNEPSASQPAETGGAI